MKYWYFLLIILGVVVFTTQLLPVESHAQTSGYSIPVNKTVVVKKQTGVFTLNNDFDYRVKVLDEYFTRSNSPLAGYGKVFIKACHKYEAPDDCTLLPAIGYIETRSCTLAASHRQFNCWGWGGAGENRVIFPNYETAIDEVTKKLMELPFYGTKFFNDPVYAQLYYCGNHCDQWGGHVQRAREDINNLAVEMGYKKLF